MERTRFLWGWEIVNFVQSPCTGESSYSVRLYPIGPAAILPTGGLLEPRVIVDSPRQRLPGTGAFSFLPSSPCRGPRQQTRAHGTSGTAQPVRIVYG